MVRLTKILHLLFVDDVLIMSKASILEWREITKPISVLCKASGLTVNQTKSIVHCEGLSHLELSELKSFLHYTFSALSFGFRYLGYFFKIGAHRAANWE